MTIDSHTRDVLVLHEALRLERRRSQRARTTAAFFAVVCFLLILLAFGRGGSLTTGVGMHTGPVFSR